VSEEIISEENPETDITEEENKTETEEISVFSGDMPSEESMTKLENEKGAEAYWDSTNKVLYIKSMGTNTSYPWSGYSATATKVVFYGSIASIKESALSGFSIVQEIVLDDNVATIEKNAFNGCTNLRTVNLPEGLKTIGESAFKDCKNLTITWNVSNAITSVGEEAFNGCTSITTVSLPELTTIGVNAFRDCTGLTTVNLPKITTIAGDYHGGSGRGAFKGCTSLEKVSIPKATTIAYSAFEGCTSLKAIELPSATTIGQYAFNGCTSLADVTFSDRLTTIGQYAFNGCKSFTDITIGTNVTTIGSNAFGGVSSLKTKLTTENDVAKSYNWSDSGRYFYDLKVYDKWDDNEPELRNWVKIANLDGQSYEYTAQTKEYYELTSEYRYAGTAKADTEITFTYELVKYNVKVYDDVDTFKEFAADGSVVWETKRNLRIDEQQKRYTQYSYDALDTAGYVLTSNKSNVKGTLLDNVEIVFTYKDMNSVPGGEYVLTINDEFYDSDGNLEKTVTRSTDRYDKGYLLTVEALTDKEIAEAAGKSGYVLDGDAKVEVTMDSDKTVTFKYKMEKKSEPSIEPIAANDISAATVTYIDAIKVKKNNAAQKPVPSKVVLGGKTLKKNTDYTISYEKDGTAVASLTSEGTYQIVLKGNGKYVGENRLDIIVTSKTPMASVKVAVNKMEYTGEAITSGVIKSVKSGKTELTEGTDYTVDYTDTLNSGKGTLVIRSVAGSSFVGTKTVTFDIKGVGISKAKVSGIANINFNGTGNIEQDLSKVSLTYKDKTETKSLTLGKDYTVSYENNSKAGTAKIIFTGKGLYNGTLKKSFKINKVTLDDSMLESTLTAAYNAAGAKPDIKLTYNGVELIEGTDYTVSCRNNKTVNSKKAPQVIITGKGNYSGKLTKEFTITQN
jgi:hypothetical protein